MRSRLASWAVSILFLVPGIAREAMPAPPPPPERISVFAAASLSAAVEELARLFEATHPGTRVDLNVASSGVLSQQIQSGAPADLFFAADPRRIVEIEQAGYADPAARRDLLSNALSVVIPRGSDLQIRTFSDLAGPGVKRLVVCDPEVAPLGAYARRYLESRGIWEALEARVVPVLDARAAMAAVASGDVDCGIVYRTDMFGSDEVEEALTFPPQSGPGIIYSLSPLKRAGKAALELADFMSSPPALDVFRRHGFLTELPEQNAWSVAPGPSPGAGAWRLLRFTLTIAFCSTLLIMIPGILLALALARWRWFGKSVVETLVSLPLVLPPTAVGLLLLDFLSRKSVAGAFLFHTLGLEVMFTPLAVIAATAVMSFPLLVRSARTAFEETPVRLEAIARTLGRGRVHVFFSITLPLAYRGILAGSVLAFSRALGEFGATIMVAGNIPGRTQTLALAIFQRAQVGDEAGAYYLLLITVLLAFAAIWTSEWLIRRKKVTS